VAVAERLGARVYQRAFDDFAGQRNDALDKIPFKHEWVLHLDADEIVTPALRAELAAAGAQDPVGASALGAAAALSLHVRRPPGLSRWARRADLLPVAGDR
jgi:hypothetical protein